MVPVEVEHCSPHRSRLLSFLFGGFSLWWTFYFSESEDKKDDGGSWALSMLAAMAFSTGFLSCFQDRQLFSLHLKHEFFCNSAYSSSFSLFLLRLFLYSRSPSSISVGFSALIGTEELRWLLLNAASILRAARTVFSDVVQLSFLTPKAMLGLSTSAKLLTFC